MKKSILFYLAMFLMVTTIFVRCKDGWVHTSHRTQRFVLGVVTIPYTGNKECLRLLQVVDDTAQYNKDSSSRRWIKSILYGYPVNDTMRDDNKKPIIDTVTKLPKMKLTYPPIPASWVNIDLSNKDIDSLLKRDSVIKK